LPTPLPGGQLPWGPPGASEAVLVQQPPDGPAVGAEFGGHLGQQPRPHQQPIGQVRPQVGEAEPGGPGGEPLVGGVAALTGQPLSTWAQPEPNLAQGPLDRPLAHVELGGELWDAVAGVAAGLQVVAQVGEAEALGASLQVAGAAVVDTNPPRMTSCRGVCAGEGSTHPFVVPGATGTGKTTLLNVLAAAVPAHERVVTIEDAAELNLPGPHVVRLEARPPNVEGRGEVALRELVRNALRMRPDRIVVGEVRGAEVLDMLQAANTGHRGLLTTLHAGGAEEVPARLEAMALAAPGAALDVVRRLIAGGIGAVVHLERGPAGRRVAALAELVAGDDGQPRALPLRSAGPALGLHATGRVPGWAHRLDPAALVAFEPAAGHGRVRVLCPRQPGR
jgi:Type II/IV secretion system protein